MAPNFGDDDASPPSVTLALTIASNEMYREYRTGRYVQALHLAEDALANNPSDSLAWAVRSACKSQLEAASREMPPPRSVNDVIAELDKESAPEFEAAAESTNSTQTRREMYRSFWNSDYPAALELAEAALRERPDDPMALAIADEARIALNLRRSIPVVRPDSEIPDDLDPRAKLVLSRVDGISTIGEIGEDVGVSPPETQRFFEEFAAVGIIDFREAAGEQI